MNETMAQTRPSNMPIVIVIIIAPASIIIVVTAVKWVVEALVIGLAGLDKLILIVHELFTEFEQDGCHY